MDISVILCTYNRCQSLAKALDSIAKSQLPEPVSWEVLVVDNNSSDHTRKLVQEFCDRYPNRFFYSFERQPGKSHALNTGIRESRGAVLAFMDDDVTVETKWLWSLTAGLFQEDWSGAGGRILAARDFSTPRWLPTDGPYNMSGVLALFDLGDEQRELDCPPFGTNMAFRRDVFDKYGAFRTDLGPRPGSEIRNEDTEFGRRLLSAGVRMRYEPSAIVYHAIPEDRLNEKYFLRFWFDLGRAAILEVVKKRDILGIPRRYFTLVKTACFLLPKRMLRWVSTFEAQQRFFRKCQVWKTMGEITEIRRELSGLGSRGTTRGTSTERNASRQQ